MRGWVSNGAVDGEEEPKVTQNPSPPDHPGRPINISISENELKALREEERVPDALNLVHIPIPGFPHPPKSTPLLMCSSSFAHLFDDELCTVGFPTAKFAGFNFLLFPLRRSTLPNPLSFGTSIVTNVGGASAEGG
jgi:hypothetical protein